MKAALQLLLLLTLAIAPESSAAPPGTVAVLSNNTGAYMEAFSAFQAELGQEVLYFDLSKGRVNLPSGTRYVVAFGAKAAAMKYPPGTHLIYCLAPGFFRDPPRDGTISKISMRPAPAALISGLKSVQPSLRNLAIFWTASAYGDGMAELRAAGKAAGLNVSLVQVDKPSELPKLLREILGKVDAFWLPPDPLLISRSSLSVFKDFSWGNSVPMYSTTRGLVQEGAVASVGVSFKASGKAAAAALKAVGGGKELPGHIYPDQTELILNSSAASRCKLTFPSDTVRSAVYLFP